MVVSWASEHNKILATSIANLSGTEVQASSVPEEEEVEQSATT
jgi:hypothetical protein